MKRVSYRYLCYSLQESLKQVFTDQQITLEMMIFWVKCAVNKVKAKRMNGRGYDSSSYLTIFTDVPTITQATDTGNIIAGEKYFTLPANILDGNLDRAIDWIAYKAPGSDGIGNYQFFERTTFTKLYMMKFNPYMNPTPGHPYFVRENINVYLIGIKDLPIQVVSMGLFTSESPYIGDMNLDDEILLNDEEVIDVINTVVMIGRFVLLIPKERIQEGSDTRDVPAYKQYSPPDQQAAPAAQPNDQPDQ